MSKPSLYTYEFFDQDGVIYKHLIGAYTAEAAIAAAKSWCDCFGLTFLGLK